MLSFLWAGVFGLALVRASSLRIPGTEGTSEVDMGGRFVVGTTPFPPRCLKIPKLSDFFRG